MSDSYFEPIPDSKNNLEKTSKQLQTERLLTEIQLDWVKSIVVDHPELEYKDNLLEIPVDYNGEKKINFTITNKNTSKTLYFENKFPAWIPDNFGCTSHTELIMHTLPQLLEVEFLEKANNFYSNENIIKLIISYLELFDIYCEYNEYDNVMTILKKSNVKRGVLYVNIDWWYDTLGVSITSIPNNTYYQNLWKNLAEIIDKYFPEKMRK